MLISLPNFELGTYPNLNVIHTQCMSMGIIKRNNNQTEIITFNKFIKNLQYHYILGKILFTFYSCEHLTLLYNMIFYNHHTISKIIMKRF